MNKKQIVVTVLVLLAVIVAVVLAVNFLGKSESGRTSAEKSSDSLSNAVENATAPRVAVPTSVNPVNQVLPDESPLEKTNPFNKTYANPFE